MMKKLLVLLMFPAFALSGVAFAQTAKPAPVPAVTYPQVHFTAPAPTSTKTGVVKGQ